MVSMQDSTLSSKVHLYISGRKLKNLDTFSKSDPICRVFEKKGNGWVHIAQTEMIKDNLNPDFEQAITLPYYFERRQDFKFEMIDDDGGGQYDLIGEAFTNMGAIMGAKAQMWSATLTKGGGSSSQGQIIVRAETVAEGNKCAKFRFRW